MPQAGERLQMSYFKRWKSYTSPGGPPVDLQKLFQVASSEQDQRQLLALFFQDMEEKIVQLSQAVRSQATEEVHQLAHSALGASRMLGMTAVAQVLERLEQVSLKDAKALLDQAVQAIKRTRTFLKTRTTKRK